jgi:hypothetical protein
MIVKSFWENVWINMAFSKSIIPDQKRDPNRVPTTYAIATATPARMAAPI